jgi:hypothetical protein
MDLQALDFQKLNNLYQMRSILTAMAININLITQGAQGQTITVANANLYQLAAQYYGDATKWTAIAKANGLSDPVVQPTIFVDLNNLLKLVFTGTVITPQNITIRLTTAIDGLNVYSYDVITGQTLTQVVFAISQLIPGSSASINVLTLPAFTNISVKVQRFVNIVIPQSAPDSGGILQS